MLPLVGVPADKPVGALLVEVLKSPPGVLVCCELVPNRPPDGSACWAGAGLEVPVGGRLNKLPWKPENCPPPDGGWLPPELMVAKGLLDSDACPAPAEKLKPLPPPPDPNENGEPPF